MNIFINDEPHETREGTILIDLLEEYGFDDFKGWAIALNQIVVSRNKLKEVILTEGDSVLLIQATQGG